MWSRGATTFATLLLLTGSPSDPLPQPTTVGGLQTLDLPGKVTDADLRELAGMKGLQVLSLGGAQVTDAGLKELAVLKGLQKLIIEGTPVTDTGLKELVGLLELKELDLNGTKVTDAGLKHLAGFQQLKWLSLNGTQVTDRGKADLKKALPKLHISGSIPDLSR